MEQIRTLGQASSYGILAVLAVIVIGLAPLGKAQAANPSYFEVSFKDGTTTWRNNSVDDEGAGIRFQIGLSHNHPFYLKVDYTQRTYSFQFDHDADLFSVGVGYRFALGFTQSISFEGGVFEGDATFGPNGSQTSDMSEAWFRTAYQVDLSRIWTLEAGYLYDGYEDGRMELNTEFALNPASSVPVSLGFGLIDGPRADYTRLFVRIGI